MKKHDADSIYDNENGIDMPIRAADGAGTLFGIGTGPGDPELMTLKALRILREADVIAIPTENAGDSMAYRTAGAACPEILQKELLCLPFSMHPDKIRRQQCRRKNAAAAAAALDQGKSIAFLTIGDPTIYSTFGYLYERLKGAGYQIEIVSGVPSFCGAAASLGIPLCCGEERLEIIPGGAFDSEMSGTTQVIMKTGSHYSEIVHELQCRDSDAHMIVRATLPEEQKYHDPYHFPEKTEYYSIIIIHE